MNHWLRNFLISTNARPMAYRRLPESRWWLLFAVTLIGLAITIGLSLAGIIH